MLDLTIKEWAKIIIAVPVVWAFMFLLLSA
jgi:hypothetical protein